MTLTSVTGYAKMHGVSKTAAQKWETRGLLRMRDGKVDVEASDQSLAHAGVGRFADAATKARRAPATTATEPEKPVAVPVHVADDLKAAAEIAEEALAPALIAFAEGIAKGEVVPHAEAAAIKENALALIRMTEARKRAGEVIELADAEAVLFETCRLQRDAWMNFPSRVGPLIAADLGVDAGQLTEALLGHVHKLLSDLGEPDDPFGQDGSAASERPQGVGAAAAIEPAGVGGPV